MTNAQYPRVHWERHQDEIDAGRAVERWLEDLVARYPAHPTREIEYKNFYNSDGSVTVFWSNRRPVGIAIAMRDQMNFTQLTLVENPHGLHGVPLVPDALTDTLPQDPDI